MSATFHVLKKRQFSSILASILLFLPVFIFAFLPSEKEKAVMVSDEMSTLIIDAGHGGIDSGALAADGSKESDINLSIAMKLRALSEFYGQSNQMIRQEDVTMSDTAAYSERRDLQHRTELVNNVENGVYISIHQNCYPTGQPSGSLVIYATGDNSELFGKLTHQNLINSLNPENRRIAEPANDDYYVLSNVSCPAILVECGFMSNFSEMEKLKSPEYQTALASVLIASFFQYIQSTSYI